MVKEKILQLIEEYEKEIALRKAACLQDDEYAKGAVSAFQVMIDDLRELVDDTMTRPLTFEELLERGGKPVFIVSGLNKGDERVFCHRWSAWCIAGGISRYSEAHYSANKPDQFYIPDYGSDWVAYEYEPEDK